jgi:radical SAM superfamily enzyme YgiQ (UPF0313 family)
MGLLELERLKNYSYEIGPIRPPSEGGSHSLLIRATRNCPWNLCKFCYGTPYHRERFQLRSVNEIKRDIDSAKTIRELLEIIAKKLGGIDRVVGVINPHYLENYQSVINVFNWLRFSSRSVFLQDADSLIMPIKNLLQVLRYLKQTFPNIKRITSYARSKTLTQKTKTLDKLKELQKAGLSRLHVGLETGDDELLKYINKGVTSEEHILAGRKIKEAGLELSEYWMPSLGGKALSKQHALNTARVLNAINPDFIRSRRFLPHMGTPLFDDWKKGVFDLLTPHEVLNEIKIMVMNLDITGKVCFDHANNPAFRLGSSYTWLFKQDYNGYQFPDEKSNVLNILKKGLEIDESLYISRRFR